LRKAGKLANQSGSAAGAAAAGAGTCTVNGGDVVCGNVQTANAAVYMISSVLMPSSS
jgi:uncharacterized surface protein with fasciclin (FAS1) repeats